MRISGIQPNHVTLIALLSGCAHSPSEGSSLGRSIHGYATKLGLNFRNVMVGTTVVDMYSKFGEMDMAQSNFDRMEFRSIVSWNTLINGYMRNNELKNARQVFDEMPERDAVSWTVIIDSFAKKGRFREALDWFQEMLLDGVAPDFVTIVSVLSAVANLGVLGFGLWVHRLALKLGFGDNIKVNNSLIDMYCRCGCVEFAHQVFDEMPRRSLISWNSIIVGLACNACAEDALHYFRSMESDGFSPDSVSFTGALMACSHAGFVDEGLELFESMTRLHGIVPRIEHYGCVVDLYSRAGRLHDALFVVERMPMKANEVVVGSLLAACRVCNDADLAEQLMKYYYNMELSGDSCHVLMSNIYAEKGSWQGASNVRKKMKALGIQKKPGISSIEVNGVVHEFLAGDQSHSDWDNIHTMLKLLSHEASIYGHDLVHF